MEQFFRIGAFARLAGVTVKTLRFYANEGLLTPAHVDAATGYRYFCADQVRDVTAILNLREAGLSLADIRMLLVRKGGSAAVSAALRSQQQTLAEERAAIDARLRVVDALLRLEDEAGVEALGEVRLVSVQPERVYALRQSQAGGGLSVTDMFEMAERAVAAASARAQRPPFLMCHSGSRTGVADVEVCIPITESLMDDPHTRVVDGASVVCSLTYCGGYHQTDPLHRRLKDALSRAGLAAFGPLREVYHRFGAGLDGYSLPSASLARRSADYVTELQLAVSAPP